MANSLIATNTGASSRITHHVFINSASATVNAANPTYIGLRVKRYGPGTTSVVAGRMGTIDVRERRKFPMLLTVRASQDRVSIHASTLMNRPCPIGSGQRRFRKYPPAAA